MADESATSMLDVIPPLKDVESANPDGESKDDADPMFSDTEETSMELDLADLIDGSSQDTEPYTPDASRLKDVTCETPTAELMEPDDDSNATIITEMEPADPPEEKATEDDDSNATITDMEPANPPKEEATKDDESAVRGESSMDVEPSMEAVPTGPSKDTDLEQTKKETESAVHGESSTDKESASEVEPTSVSKDAEPSASDTEQVAGQMESAASGGSMHKEPSAEVEPTSSWAEPSSELRPTSGSKDGKLSSSETDTEQVADHIKSAASGDSSTDEEPSPELQPTSGSKDAEPTASDTDTHQVAEAPKEADFGMGEVPVDDESSIPASKSKKLSAHNVSVESEETDAEPSTDDTEAVSKLTSSELSASKGEDASGKKGTAFLTSDPILGSKDTGRSAPDVEPTSEKSSDVTTCNVEDTPTESGPELGVAGKGPPSKNADALGGEKTSNDTGGNVPDSGTVSGDSNLASRNPELTSKVIEQNIEYIDIFSSDEEEPPKKSKTKNGKKTKQTQKTNVTDKSSSSRAKSNQLQIAATCSLDDGSEKLDVQEVKHGAHAVSVFFIKENSGSDTASNSNESSKVDEQVASKGGTSGSIQNQQPVQPSQDQSNKKEAPKQTGLSLSSDDDIIIDEVIESSAAKKAPSVMPPSYKTQQQRTPTNKQQQPASVFSALKKTQVQPVRQPSNKRPQQMLVSRPMQSVSGTNKTKQPVSQSKVNKPTSSHDPDDIVEIDAPSTSSGGKNVGTRKRPGRKKDPWVKSDYTRRKERLQKSLRERRPNPKEASKDYEYDASAGLALDVESHPDEAMQSIVQSIQKTSLSNDTVSQGGQDDEDEDIVMVMGGGEDDSGDKRGATKRSEHEMVSCHVCHTKLTRSSLNRHLVLHLNFKLFHCRFCEVETSDSSLFVKHLREKHNKTLDRKVDCVCRRCGRNCKRIIKLLKHAITHKDSLVMGLNVSPQRKEKSQPKGTRTGTGKEGHAATTRPQVSGQQTAGARHASQGTKTLVRNERGQFVQPSSTLKETSSSPVVSVGDDDNDILMEEVPLDEDLPTCSKMFDCVQCDISCTDTAFYIDHVKMQHKVSPKFQCPLCSTVYINVKNFVSHLKVKNCMNLNRLQCHMCEYVASDSTDLAEHEMNTHFICHVCKKEFLQVDTLQQHLLTHLKFKPFHCFSCKPAKSEFSDLEKYKQHMSWAHKGQKIVYECPKCKTFFSGGEDLSRHIFNHVTLDDFVKEPEKKEDPAPAKKYSTVYKCPKCQYTCINMQVWQFHLKNCKASAQDSTPTPGSIKNDKTAVEVIRLSPVKGSPSPGSSAQTPGGANIRFPVSPTKTKIFRCTKCNFISSNTEEHTRHVISKHNAKNIQYQCHLCKALFTSPATLVAHVETQSKPKATTTSAGVKGTATTTCIGVTSNIVGTPPRTAATSGIYIPTSTSTSDNQSPPGRVLRSQSQPGRVLRSQVSRVSTTTSLPPPVVSPTNVNQQRNAATAMIQSFTNIAQNSTGQVPSAAGGLTATLQPQMATVLGPSHQQQPLSPSKQMQVDYSKMPRLGTIIQPPVTVSTVPTTTAPPFSINRISPVQNPQAASASRLLQALATPTSSANSGSQMLFIQTSEATASNKAYTVVLPGPITIPGTQNPTGATPQRTLTFPPILAPVGSNIRFRVMASSTATPSTATVTQTRTAANMASSTASVASNQPRMPFMQSSPVSIDSVGSAQTTPNQQATMTVVSSHQASAPVVPPQMPPPQLPSPDPSSSSDSEDEDRFITIKQEPKSDDEAPLKSAYRCDLCQTEYVQESALLNHQLLVHSQAANISQPTGDLTSKPDEGQQDTSATESAEGSDEDDDDVGFHYTVSDDGDDDDDDVTGAHESRQPQRTTSPRRHSPSSSNITNWKCYFEKCGKDFPHFNSLFRHVLIHIGIKIFKCNFCGYSYSDSSTYIRHSKKKHDMVDVTYNCLHCGHDTLTSPRDLLMHMAQHPEFCRETYFYNCYHCSCFTTTATEMQAHVTKKHDKRNKYHCYFCPSDFAEQRFLNKHMFDLHLPKRRIKCGYCAFSTHDATAYLPHMERDHDASKYRHRCPTCQQVVKLNVLESHLLVHSLTYITGGTVSVQAACYMNTKGVAHDSLSPRQDTKDDALETGASEAHKDGKHKKKKKHKNKHHTEDDGTLHAESKCYFCNTEFAQKGSLRRHMWLHIDFKPFKCYMCKVYSTGDDSNYNKHMLSNHGCKDPFYECQVCFSKRTKYKDLLTHYELVHSINLYKCSKCQQSYDSAKKLNKHFKTSNCGMASTTATTNLPVPMAITAPTSTAMNTPTTQPTTVREKTWKEGDQCRFCVKTFPSSFGLARHEKTHTKPFVCHLRWCLQRSSENVHLINHQIKTQHKGLWCKFCPTKFRAKKELVMHEDSHRDKEMYSCVACTRTFVSFEHLVKHTDIYMENYPEMTCQICAEKLALPCQMLVHEENHSKQTVSIFCPFCSALCSNINTYNEHQRDAHGVINLTQGEDPVKLAGNAAEKKRTCPFCFVSCTSPQTMNSHLKTAHMIDAYLAACVTRTMWKNAVNIQVGDLADSKEQDNDADDNDDDDDVGGGVNDDDANRLTCKFCSAKFTDRALLRSHEAAHTETMNQPFPALPSSNIHECRKCGFTFKTASELSAHLLLHKRRLQEKLKEAEKQREGKGGEKPIEVMDLVDEDDDEEEQMNSDADFACPFCDKKYSDKQNLMKHIMSHAGQNVSHGGKLNVKVQMTFKCDVCSASFKYQDKLKKHKKKHSADDGLIYKCKFCSKEFNRLSSYHQHNKIAHAVGQVEMEKRPVGRPRKDQGNLDSSSATKISNAAQLGGGQTEGKNKVQVIAGKRPVGRPKKKTFFGNIGFGGSPKDSMQGTSAADGISHVAEGANKSQADTPIGAQSQQTKACYRYICKFCNRRFRKKKRWNTHVAQCNVTKSNITTQVQSGESGVANRNSCKFCNKRFRKRKRLNQHVAQCHLATPTGSANIAGADTRVVGSSGDKKQTKPPGYLGTPSDSAIAQGWSYPHKCKECTALFRKKSALNRHIIQLHGNKKTPSERSKLLSGMGSVKDGGRSGASKKTKGGDAAKKFKCATCNERFSREVSLLRHLPVHKVRLQTEMTKELRSLRSSEAKQSVSLSTDQNVLGKEQKSGLQGNVRIQLHRASVLDIQEESANTNLTKDVKDPKPAETPRAVTMATTDEGPVWIYPYYCEYCNAPFAKSMIYKRHLKKHNRKRKRNSNSGKADDSSSVVSDESVKRGRPNKTPSPSAGRQRSMKSPSPSAGKPMDSPADEGGSITIKTEDVTIKCEPTTPKRPRGRPSNSNSELNSLLETATELGITTSVDEMGSPKRFRDRPKVDYSEDPAFPIDNYYDDNTASKEFTGIKRPRGRPRKIQSDDSMASSPSKNVPGEPITPVAAGALSEEKEEYTIGMVLKSLDENAFGASDNEMSDGGEKPETTANQIESEAKQIESVSGSINEDVKPNIEDLEKAADLYGFDDDREAEQDHLEAGDIDKDSEKVQNKMSSEVVKGTGVVEAEDPRPVETPEDSAIDELQGDRNIGVEQLSSEHNEDDKTLDDDALLESNEEEKKTTKQSEFDDLQSGSNVGVEHPSSEGQHETVRNLDDNADDDALLESNEEEKDNALLGLDNEQRLEGDCEEAGEEDEEKLVADDEDSITDENSRPVMETKDADVAEEVLQNESDMGEMQSEGKDAASAGAEPSGDHQEDHVSGIQEDQALEVLDKLESDNVDEAVANQDDLQAGPGAAASENEDNVLDDDQNKPDTEDLVEVDATIEDQSGQPEQGTSEILDDQNKSETEDLEDEIDDKIEGQDGQPEQGRSESDILDRGVDDHNRPAAEDFICVDETGYGSKSETELREGGSDAKVRDQNKLDSSRSECDNLDDEMESKNELQPGGVINETNDGNTLEKKAVNLEQLPLTPKDEGKDELMQMDSLAGTECESSQKEEEEEGEDIGVEQREEEANKGDEKTGSENKEAKHSDEEPGSMTPRAVAQSESIFEHGDMEMQDLDDGGDGNQGEADSAVTQLSEVEQGDKDQTGSGIDEPSQDDNRTIADGTDTHVGAEDEMQDLDDGGDDNRGETMTQISEVEQGGKDQTGSGIEPSQGDNRTIAGGTETPVVAVTEDDDGSISIPDEMDCDDLDDMMNL